MIRILALLASLFLSIENMAMGQEKIIVANGDSTLIVNSIRSKFDYVEDLHIQGANFQRHWLDLPVPDSTPCEGIFDLTSTCAVLDLPLIYKILTLNDSIVALYGNCHNGAIQVKQMILLNIFSGKDLGWYAYFTGRSDGLLKCRVDEPSRTMVIGSRENAMLESEFYIVDRTKMQFRRYGANQEWLWKMVARMISPAMIPPRPRVYYGIRF